MKNYSEVLVANKLDEVLAQNDVCTCDRCKADITAIALNNLPPKYVVSTEGECYAKTEVLENQIAIDIITAISKGIKVVSKFPRHSN